MGSIKTTIGEKRRIIVVGYAGNDNSVMTVLEQLIKANGLKRGVYWCQPKGVALSTRAKQFMEEACNLNEDSAVVDINDFDDLLHRLYLAMNIENSYIDSLWKQCDTKPAILYEGIGKHSSMALTNALQAIQYPRKCYVFESSIKTWKELKNTVDNTCIAILCQGKVWALGNKTDIANVFSNKVIGSMDEMDIPVYMMKLEDSDIIGMFYAIIKMKMQRQGLLSYGKNKYYDSTTKRYENGYFIFDALKVSLSFVDDNMFLNLLPAIHVLNTNGKELDRFEYQRIINRKMSMLYNSAVDSKINEWIKRLLSNGRIAFELGNAILEFDATRVKFVGTNAPKKCFQAQEPKVMFDYEQENCVAVNQLKGLMNYGPIETYANRNLRLAVLTPRECARDIWQHLNRLNSRFVTTMKQDADFLPEYTRFQDVFRCSIDVPNGNDGVRFKGYSLNKVINLDARAYFSGICQYIDSFEKDKTEFDVLIIYIPKQLEKMREVKNETVYFDLHDSLKIYCAGKGIVTQIIEERSVHTNNDMAKIIWGLSTALYTKGIGRLWKPEKARYDTAYVGLSYVQSIKNNEKISIGCSQLFDSEGNGMQLYLRPLKNPQMIQDNPFMRSEDACRLMNKLKRIYDESVPLHKLNRIVIHKTTRFTKEEMDGITKGLAGVDNIELLQIQEYSAWRAIHYQNDKVAPFPIQRGTVIPLDKDSFLIWTHGSVQHDELAGRNRNYYKNSRGIPAPLLVRRFMGKSTAEELVNEILMLTKMNWNSGDGLYKMMPVTLDFAKTLSRVAKQDLVVYDRPYDFRYFM